MGTAGLGCRGELATVGDPARGHTDAAEAAGRAVGVCLPLDHDAATLGVGEGGAPASTLKVATPMARSHELFESVQEIKSSPSPAALLRSSGRCRAQGSLPSRIAPAASPVNENLAGSPSDTLGINATLERRPGLSSGLRGGNNDDTPAATWPGLGMTRTSVRGRHAGGDLKSPRGGLALPGTGR